MDQRALGVMAVVAALSAGCAHPAPPPLNPSPAAAPMFSPPIDSTDPACATNQLTITPGLGEGGGSHESESLVFRNHGGTCNLTGYPTVTMLDAGGNTIAKARPTFGGYLGGYRPPADGRLPQNRLTRGATASAMVEGEAAAVDSSLCPLPTTMRISPPGQPESVQLPAITVCDPQVHPILPGVISSYPPQPR